jgi:gag-polyprotein putative aspartyl protease
MNQGTFHFKRKDEESLVLVFAEIDSEPVTLALDTGATHTVLDLTMLIIAGYTLNDVIRTVEIETAKGTIEAYVFKIKKLTSLGVTLKDKEICSYDFLANNVLSSIDGVLGLDFFRGRVLTIDFQQSQIVIK